MTLRQLAHPASPMTTSMPFPKLMQQNDSITLLVNFIYAFFRWLCLVGKKREISHSILIKILKVLVKWVLKHSLFLIWLCYYSRTTTSDSLFYFTILFFNIYIYFHYSQNTSLPFLFLSLFSLPPFVLQPLCFSRTTHNHPQFH